MAINDKQRKVVVGSGRIYFRPDGDDGEIYLGETPGFTLTPSVDMINVMSSDTPTAEQIVSQVKSVDRRAQITCDNISLDNLMRFIIGTEHTVVQVATPVLNEEATVAGGAYYQLGVDDAHPTGIKGVTAVTVSARPAAGQAHQDLVVDRDYEVDLDLGRVRMITHKTDHGPLQFDYTPVAQSHLQLRSTDDAAIEGTFRFIADNTVGPNRDVYGPKVRIYPSGEAAWKSRDNATQLSFSVEFLLPDGDGEAIYIDGRAA